MSQLKTTRSGGSPRQGAGPSASLPSGGAVIDVATTLRLEPCLGDLGTEKVVLWELEVTEPLNETLAKALIDRGVDHDLMTDDGIIRPGSFLAPPVVF